MKKSKFSEEQIATALRQIDAGAPVLEVTRKLGISEATYYVWRKRYGQIVSFPVKETVAKESFWLQGWPDTRRVVTPPTHHGAAPRCSSVTIPH